MEMNVEVTEVTSSREADTGLTAADSSVGSGDVDVRNDIEESTSDEPRPRAPGNGKNAEGEKREDIATNSSRATSIADCEVESSRVSQTPLAFTIDFGNNKEVDTAKYQNLFERYNARHRRNLSTSKVFKILCVIFDIL